MTLVPVSTKPRRTDVGKLRVGRLIQVIALDQADPGASILSAHNRGVATGIKRRDDG